MKSLPNFTFNTEFLNQNAIKSNRVYGQAIFDSEAIEIIQIDESRVDAWVGGVNGTMAEGGGIRRRLHFSFEDSGLNWKCTCNPKKHQIFCKHCVGLALYLEQIK